MHRVDSRDVAGSSASFREDNRTEEGQKSPELMKKMSGELSDLDLRIEQQRQEALEKGIELFSEENCDYKALRAKFSDRFKTIDWMIEIMASGMLTLIAKWFGGTFSDIKKELWGIHPFVLIGYLYTHKREEFISVSKSTGGFMGWKTHRGKNFLDGIQKTLQARAIEGRLTYGNHLDKFVEEIRGTEDLEKIARTKAQLTSVIKRQDWEAFWEIVFSE